MDEKAVDHSDVLDEARERFERINQDDNANRQNYKADLAFVYSPGAQWPDNVRATRESWKELCLEFNQLKQFVAQVVNDQLQNRPGIKVHPSGGDASEEVAEIIQGMIRAIEYDSKADDVYKLAFRLAVAAGRGWWRVVSEYESQDGFEQKLRILPIQDSNTVFADTDYQMPDGSDRAFVFVAQSYSKEAFLAKWPNKEPLDWGSLPAYWSDGKESVIVADYYRRVCKKRTLVEMSDGAVGWLDEMPPPPAGITEVRRRDVDTWKVEWFTIAGGDQVLEAHEWPGSVIPVVCVPGEDVILDGKRVYQGLTRHARDAQSMLNFGMTQQATQLALSPRAPWVMAEGQNEGYESMWRDANTKNWSALVYKPVTIDGQLAPPPQRTQPAMISDGWDRWCQTMIQMIKSTIGMYEQSLGMRGQETSGRAIIAREKQGDTATFNYVNNWHMAIALTGRIIVECMPTYYDTHRIVATIADDDTEKMVAINEPSLAVEHDGEAAALEAIRRKDITKGRYAVTVSAGPSYATKREESREALTAFVQAFPAAAQVAADLIVKSLDIADADVLSDRLKFMLPPQVQQAEQAKEKGQTPPDPRVMAEMQQLQGALQQAQATMQAMDAEVQKLRSGELSKVEAAKAEAALKIHLADLEAQAKEAQAARAHQLALEEAQAQANIALTKAGIDAEAKIEAAKIDQQTKLTIAGIENEPEEEKPDRLAEALGQFNLVVQQMNAALTQLGRPKRRVLERDQAGRAIGMVEVD